MAEDKEMSFIEHLEELRMHIIRALIAILAMGLVLFVSKDILFNTILFGPTRADFFTYTFTCHLSELVGLGESICLSPVNLALITLNMGEAFLLHIKVSLIGGFVAAFPYVFWELWQFVRPGLNSNERNSAGGVVFVCSILFLLGVLFGYYVIAPFAVNFLAGYSIEGVNAGANQIQATSFINYMVMFTVPTGIVFELPILVFFLARSGVITPQIMRAYRRHAVVAILVLAALITPPDVVTQFLIGIPLFILYEISILIATREAKRYNAREAAHLAELQRYEARQKAEKEH